MPYLEYMSEGHYKGIFIIKACMARPGKGFDENVLKCYFLKKEDKMC